MFVVKNNQVVDEIYSYCDHVAPWAPGTSRVPSSAFCLLMKLFVMKLTRPQMNEILVHEVRGRFVHLFVYCCSSKRRKNDFLFY